MKLVFATHNKNKFKEVKSLMPAHIELLSLTDIGCFEEIAETAKTIEGNAVLKANYIKERYDFDCFADDTGLEVEALNNEPGVYSARYAGPDNNAEANIAKLLTRLAGKSNRKARFKTAIALTYKTDDVLFLGVCDGTITSEKKGEEGFGYDPVFQPDGASETFAEMSQSQKNEIGHRGKAIRQLIDYLSE
ncbi:MAG: non-canonical purine NTP diphosphatase [Flavobacteriales bacterium]|jgi:XTP/dITP diphosphohydrolase|uniref:non-canonical purine NTP diphosphatase n=1 Tax=Candidatus Ulvibacter alkanivorans TaxID=2267620 RepID=UPI000DF3E87B|nr:non-canonical purine NTP diphosphatase [Candidatus Ulvibacter alkanivorans]MCH2488845.1 non-canonical purine NTP diphosphatase [Flavobacteriales bacterium]